MSVFSVCESCKEIATRTCRSTDPARFFCDYHCIKFTDSPGEHPIQAALHSLSAAEVSCIQEALREHRQSSLSRIIQARNSIISLLLNQMRKTEEECSSMIEDILNGQAIQELQEVLFKQALPLYSESPLLQSLLGLKQTSNISAEAITEELKSVTSSSLTLLTKTSSTQTDPPPNASVQTSFIPALYTETFPSQVSIIPLTDCQWELQKQIQAHTDWIYAISVSECEKYIASASADNTIKIWELQTLALIRTLKGHEKQVKSVAFSGKKVVSGSSDTTIKIWEEDQCLSTINTHLNEVNSVCVSSSKRLIASGSLDKTVIVHRLEDSSILNTLNHAQYVFSVAFSSNDQEIVSGCMNGGINVWNTETGELLNTLDAHSGHAFCVNYSRKLIVSSSEDMTVKVWDKNQNEILVDFNEHAAQVVSLDVKDNLVASLGVNDEILLWDIRNGQIVQKLEEGHGNYSVCGFHWMGLKVLNRGTFIITGGWDRNIKLWKRVN